MLSLLVCLCPALSLAQQTGITRKHHPWGHFNVGAWARVRVVTEAFDGNDAISSVTETKTTLQKLEEDGVTLRIEAAVEVGGRQIRSEPQTVKQGWHGEFASQEVKTSNLGVGEVVIQGRKIPCKVVQLESKDPMSRMITKIYYSDTIEPYVLRREITRTDLEGKTTLGQTTVEVVAFNVPCRILARLWNTYHVKRVHTRPKGKATTVAVTSPRVPGGVIRQDSKEYDGDGRLVRRSSLELLDYGLEPEEEWTGLLRRKRSTRFRKFRRFSPYRFQLPTDDGP